MIQQRLVTYSIDTYVEPCTLFLRCFSQMLFSGAVPTWTTRTPTLQSAQVRHPEPPLPHSRCLGLAQRLHGPHHLKTHHEPTAVSRAFFHGVVVCAFGKKVTAS